MEQLHLHGQHGFGTNIFRGLPPPPSNLKVRIDLVAPLGLWWVCKLGAAGDEGSWAVSLDSGRQPVRLLLVDSISDNSVFATCEVPRRAESRPAAVLLARSEAAFQRVLERAPNQLGGGSGASESACSAVWWSSMLEFHGDLCCWGQVKTLPMAASHSPWDFFGSFSCGQSSSTPNDTSFGRVTPLDELLAKFPRMHGSMLQSASSTAGQQEPFLRMNLPLRLTSGANSQSMLSGLAMLVRSGYDLAALRLHVSLPKVLEALLSRSPFEASMPDVKRPKAANVVPASNARRQMSNVQPVSLHFLEQAPPLLLALGALLAASAVVLAGGRKSCMASKCGEGPRERFPDQAVNIMRATLPSRFALALDGGVAHAVPGGRPLRRSLHTAPAPAGPAASATLGGVAVTSSGPIGQALLEKVSAVSAKLDSILGDASNGSRPKARSMATSLGERLMDLTERSLALCGMNGIEREASVVSATPAPATPARVAPVAQAVPVEAQLAEASVKAVARSLLDAARQRSHPQQFTPVAAPLIRAPPSSRSTTPAATSRTRSPGSSMGTMGLTPPPGLFIPSGFTTPLTPGGALGAPLGAPLSTPMALPVAPALLAPSFESLAQNASRHLSGGTPRTLGGRWSPPAPPSAAAAAARSVSLGRMDAESKIRKLAVLLGRRALYDRLQGQRGDHADPSEVFKFFAATLHVLLAMGFPVHRSSLPLAAWVGSVELLQVLSQGCKDFNVTSTQGTELMSWSARGVYANPAKGPVQVLKWLMHRKASPEQRDSAGRSVLDWACWAGCDELVSFLLRRRPALDDPQPLLLAAASRSSSLVRLLLRAAGDPHAVPNTGDSHSAACGALMLAVRCCEFELACEVLRSAGAVNVAVALGTGRSAPRLGMENEEKPGSATRATVALVESFRRFANGLQRRSVEEVSVAGIRAHLPGPHPDENLYATSNMPLGDVLHPLVAKLSSPMHRVPLELRPGLLPLAWLRRTSTPDPWAPARLMVECLVQRGFRADAAFLSKVGLALPPEVQSLTGRLTEGTEGAPMLPMLLTDIIPDMRRADEISILKDAYGMPVGRLEKRIPEETA
eukprot:g32789.t1